MKSAGQSNVRVFVVWEPVLVTDWGNPSGALTSYVADARAKHFWDHDRRLSALWGGPGRAAELATANQIGFRMKDVIWDSALVYPPGARWGDKAKLLVAPVAKYSSALAGAL